MEAANGELLAQLLDAIEQGAMDEETHQKFMAQIAVLEAELHYEKQMKKGLERIARLKSLYYQPIEAVDDTSGSIMDMSESTIAVALATPADSNSRGHITKMASEILIQIIKELGAFDSTCFGLTCTTAYNAFKAVYPHGVGIDTVRNWDYPHALGCDPLRNKKRCNCWVENSLAAVFKLPETFKHTDFARNYRLCINRGDHNVVFLNNAAYGSSDKEKEMVRRYGVYGHFKHYNQYVMKGGSCRLVCHGESMPARRGTSLIPTPSGKSYGVWSAQVVNAMIGDLKWWSRKEDWAGFWKTGFEKCGVNIFCENEKVLEQAAAKHVWPVVDERQAKIAERMIERYCLVNNIGRN